MVLDVKIFGLIVIGFALIGIGTFLQVTLGSEDFRMMGIPFAIGSGGSFVYALVLVFKKYPESKNYSVNE
jgi:xanthine/uracil permease